MRRRDSAPEMAEMTALGAAYLAGLKTGFYESEEKLKEFVTADGYFSPSKDERERERLIGGWKAAVARCRSQ